MKETPKEFRQTIIAGLLIISGVTLIFREHEIIGLILIYWAVFGEY